MFCLSKGEASISAQKTALGVIKQTLRVFRFLRRPRKNVARECASYEVKRPRGVLPPHGHITFLSKRQSKAADFSQSVAAFKDSVGGHETDTDVGAYSTESRYSGRSDDTQ